MATIVQFNKIQSNEDILERLVSDAGATVDIAVRNIPSLPASRINSGTFQTARIPSLPASQITSGTIDDARLGTGVGTVLRREDMTGTGSGLTVSTGGAVSVNVASNNALAVNSSGELEVSPLNLGSAHTFTSVAARNAGFPFDGGSQTSPEIVWNRGDIAIVTANTMTRTNGTVQLPGTPQMAETAIVADSNTDRDTIRGYLTSMTTPLSGRFTVEGPITGTYGATADDAENNPTGTITIPNGAFFSFNNAAILFFQPGQGATPAQTIRTGPQLNNAFIRLTGPLIPGGQTIDTGVGLGTYVFVDDDQPSAAASSDDNWELLRTPTATNIDAGAITSGTLADARIPAAIARDSELSTVAGTTGRILTDISVAGSILTIGSTQGDLTFSGGGGTIDRYFATVPQGNGARTVTFGIVAGNGQVDLSAFGGSSATRTFPTNTRAIEVYLGGMLLHTAEYSTTTTALSVTFPASDNQDGTAILTVILRA